MAVSKDPPPRTITCETHHSTSPNQIPQGSAHPNPSPESPWESYLARALEDVAAVAAAPGAGPPDQLLPRDAHRVATVLAAAPAWRGAGVVVVVVAGVLVLRRGGA